MTKPAILAAGIGLAGALLLGLGVVLDGPARWLVWWVALSCIAASAAYGANWPGVYGKRDGVVVWWRALPLLPYLGAYWIATLVRKLLRDYPSYEEVAPGLYVGGRVPARKLPHGVARIVDLTAEMPIRREIRRMAGYRGHPVLDGSFPHDEEAFLALVWEVGSVEGAVYVHCESGVGRAPTAAAVVLLARGIVDGADAAIELVKKGRPAAAPTLSDLRFVERMARRIRSAAAAPGAATASPGRAAGRAA
ncbi:MAG: hypothetical protein JRH19_09590 [Deltaproteobacteria bacterium]|nr:hypothetical protein [Deltaproteobacteria bacterium]